MKTPIYFDYSATTPVDSRVAVKMMECMTIDGNFANSASNSHIFGWKAKEAVENARQQVADLINADPREIVWTSGATEADNLAIKGVAHFYKGKGKHLITSKIEHKAVIDSFRQLEREGYEVTYLDPNDEGIINLENVKNNVRSDTILVSLMHVNNEVGSVNDIKSIGSFLREKGIVFHVDAAQSAGKIDINLKELPVNLMSFSAHKIYGPKGIGALYVSRSPRTRVEAQIHGGGHERGMRSGTLPVHQIVGMGEAFSIAKKEMKTDNEKFVKLRELFLDNVKDIEEYYYNGSLTNFVPNIVNVSFNYVEGESLMMSLKDIAVSSGSACTSASLEPSYVLRALGRNDELAHSSLRFSFGKWTTEEEVLYAAKQLRGAVDKLRELSPLWEMFKDGIDLSTIEWVEH